MQYREFKMCKLEKIFAFVSRVAKSKIVDNFFHLSLLQGIGFFIPIVIIPYLTVKLGYEKLGMVYFAQSFMIYLSAIPEYGFNITATQEIAVSKSRKEKLAVIFSSVLTVRLFLLVAAFSILFILVSFIDKFHNDSFLYYSSFLIVIGQTLQPTFFFQGVEEMRYMAYLSFLSKLFFCLLIFLLIKKESDYLYVNIILGSGNIIFSFISLFTIWIKYKIRYIFTSLDDLFQQLYNSFSIFVSTFSVVAYMNSNLFILGLFASKHDVGIYSVAEKIFLVVRQLLAIFSQAIYPRVCILVQQSKNSVIRFFKSVFPLFIILVITLQTLLAIFAISVVKILTHTNSAEMVQLIRISAFIPIIVCLNIPAYQILLANKKVKVYSGILIFGGLINVAGNVFFARMFSYYGTVLSIYVTEIFITLLFWIYAKRFHYIDKSFFKQSFL